MELAECEQFGHVDGDGHEFDPPPAVSPLEFVFEVFYVIGGYCGFSNVEFREESPCIGPPGIFGFGSQGFVCDDCFLDDGVGDVFN